jgi:pre-mRNA-processing factor 19
VLCLHVTEQKLATGGMDGNVVLFDMQKKEKVQALKGHAKPVTAVQLHPTRNAVVSASQDSTARVWVSSKDDNWAAPHKCTYVSKLHSNSVTAVGVHPIGDVFATASLDKSWAVHDLNVGRCLRHVDNQASGYNCLNFHPDGLILGCGAEEGVVQVWDLKAQVIAAELKGHTAGVSSLMFSENGYYLVTGSKDCSVKLWDLRKPICFQTITLDGKQPVNCVAFDHSGQFLAISTDKVEVCNFEGKTSVAPTCTLADHAPGTAVTGVSILPNAKKLVSCGMDRMVKIYE